MTPTGKHDGTVRDPIATMEALLDDVAEQAAEDYVPTADDLRWARELRATVERRLANLERRPRRAATDTSERHDVIVPAEIQALDREGLLARLEILRQDPNVQWAHHDLTGLSDDGLRRLLADLMSLAERQ